jgi:hypothetical protein
VGRPTLLTDQVREQVERELAAGVPVLVVAQNAGVATRTLHSWLGDGRVVRRSKLHLVEKTPREDLAQNLRDDDERIEAELVGAVLEAAYSDSASG